MVCAPGCEKLSPSPGSNTLTSCPIPSQPWFGPYPVLGCTGDFICDSDGVPLGDGPVHRFDQGNGFIFWCENGVLQQVNMRLSP